MRSRSRHILVGAGAGAGAVKNVVAPAPKRVPTIVEKNAEKQLAYIFINDFRTSAMI